ncbi:MAG: right-handed parallel beta-helix repeat-containing protein [bacterium]|nr:right-handed parallel beta-helix repeat-containing protein [bacterium]
MTTNSCVCRFCALLMTSIFIALPVVADDDEEKRQRTVRVDCSRHSIAKALKKRAEVLIVEISGQCQESVLIQRDRVTLRGVSEDAAILSPGDAPAVEIIASQEVAIEQLQLEGGAANGVRAKGLGSLSVVGVTVQNSRSGLVLSDGMIATVTDSSFVGNSRDGISVSQGVNLKIGGNILISDNARMGLFASALSTVNFSENGCQLEANGNWIGLWVSSGSIASLVGPMDSSTEAIGNSRYGIAALNANVVAYDIETSGSFAGIRTLKLAMVELQGDIHIADCDSYGLYSTSESVVHIAGSAVFEGTGSAALYSGSGASVFGGDYSPLTIRDNFGWGVLVDGGRIGLWNTTVTGSGLTDVDLRFGAIAEFQDGSVVGSITCEESVLIRGDVACPAPAPLSAATIGVVTKSTRRDVAYDLLPPLVLLEQ